MELEWEEDYEIEENENEGEEETETETPDTADAPLNAPVITQTTPKPATQTAATTSTIGRTRKPPVWPNDYITGEELSDMEEEANMVRVESEDHIALMIITDPTTFEEAAKQLKWKKAMDTEIDSIKKNETCSLIELPNDAKSIGVKWNYKIKLNEMGEVDKFKARLVVKRVWVRLHGSVCSCV